MVIVVGGIVKYALIEIVAGAINSAFVFVVAKVTATVLLVDRV